MGKRVGRPRAKLTTEPTFLRRHATTLLALALLGIGLHNLFGAHGFLALRRMQAEAAALRTDLDRLHKENQTLAEQVNGLKTDPKVIERIAREEMGMAKDGELIFKIPAGKAETKK